MVSSRGSCRNHGQGIADGATGYISTRWVRSPIDFRLTLRVDDRADTWWLGFLVAGD